MGHDEYGLKSLADDQLLSGLASIVRRRNQITAEFLAYLAELDERQLFLDLGFSSLFEYCTVKLGLCESTAGRHIAAGRVCRKHPEVFALVASGALHASALSLLKKHLTLENAAELFELCAHRSTRKVEELLAARFPRPDVRDLVRRLPARAAFTLDVERWAERASTDSRSRATSVGRENAGAEVVSRESSTELEETLVNSSPSEFCAELDTVPVESPSQSSSGKSTEAEVAPVESQLSAPAVARGSAAPESRRFESLSAALVSTEAAKRRRFEPLSADRFGVHFTADGDFCALLERVRGLAGHRLPSGDLLTLLKRGLEAYERELEKERFAVGGKTRHRRDVAPTPGALFVAEVQPAHVQPAHVQPAHVQPAHVQPAHVQPTALTGPGLSATGLSGLELSMSDLPASNPQPMTIPRPRRKRHYPAAIVRAVFIRDGRECSYVSPDGRRCCARRCLELDHIEPWAAGGEDTIENLRLRCRAHNQRYARLYFGSSRVDAAIQDARRWRPTRPNHTQR